MPRIGKVVIGPPEPKNVVVRPVNRTTISSPNFTPKINVSISDIESLNVSVRRDGDVIVYDATSGEYVSSSLSGANIDITEIRGGKF